MLESTYLKLSHHVCAFFQAQYFFASFLVAFLTPTLNYGEVYMSKKQPGRNGAALIKEAPFLRR